MKEMQLRKNMLAVGLLSVVLSSGCALGSNAPGRAAGAVKDGARRETMANVAEEDFSERLLQSEASRWMGRQGGGTPRTIA